MQGTGPTVYSPYPRRLECLTISRYNYKGSTFSSVILRPWVLVRSGARTLDLPHRIFQPKFAVPFLLNLFFALIREFEKSVKSGKSHSYWLARFNWKLSFHFARLLPLISDMSVWHNSKHPLRLCLSINSETYAFKWQNECDTLSDDSNSFAALNYIEDNEQISKQVTITIWL